MKIGLIVLVLFIAFCNAFSYWNMRCPSQSEWGVISSWVCNGSETKKYTCLYNAIRRQYEESCKFQPVISGNGSQYVISVYPNSEPCRNYDRYQPFPLGSNAGSDCVFQKSTCSEEGNILFHHGSPKTDLSCRCNFQKGFGFVNEIPNRCDCIPSQEDCSCYLKQCPLGHRLISDYACLHEDDRKHIVKCPEMGHENSRKMTTHLRQLSSKELKNIEFLNRRIDFIGLICLTGICVVYAIVASLLIITDKIPKMCYIDICPFNLEITPDGSSLRISWSISDKVPTLDILGYNIYYTFNGQWEQLGVRKCKQYSFDILKPSKTYRFKVSATLRNGVESKCTEEKTFNTEYFFPIVCAIDICPFNLKITPDGSSLRISWSISNKVPTIDILGYNIHYTYNGQWKQFGVRKYKQYSFNKLKPGKTYRFKVSACLRNRVESRCTEEETFNTELPIQPKAGIPKGENSKIVLTWDSPMTTLIQIEGYEIQWTIDPGQTIAYKTNVASNVFRHEIETTEEDVTYRVKICSYSNSVKSLYEVFHPFTTGHDVFIIDVKYDTNDQKGRKEVQNNVVRKFKQTCNGTQGVHRIIHTSEREGSIIVTIMFISEGLDTVKVLHDTLKNAFQNEKIGSDTITFKSFCLKRLNNPSPPNNVKVSSVNNGVLVSWKEPFITFFKTKKYVVEYFEDDWKYSERIVVPVDENSCFITKVSPSANIRVKVYTCICHKYRSSSSPVVSTVVKENTSTVPRWSTREKEQVYHNIYAASDLALQDHTNEKTSSNTDTTIVLSTKDIVLKVESASKAKGEKTTMANTNNLTSSQGLCKDCKMPNKKNNESQKEKKAERTYSEDEVLASMSYFTESFRQVIYRELYDQDTEGSAVPANETGVIEPPFLGTTSLYSRPDMINPKEANQQSDVQSARTTMELKKSTSLPFAHNLHQETENDSIWLFEVLDNIGVNDGYRKICREEAIIQEIINTFSSDVSVWNVGSYCEGTFIPGIESDADTILCYEVIKVVEAISIADVKRPSLLIVRESQTPAGYVKLQFVACCVPIELNHWPAICAHWPGVAPFFTTDKLDRIVLIGILSENLGKCPLLSRAKNKPAAKLENYPSIKLDMVQCYRCKAWPTIANEWLTRHRCYGWPTTKTIEEMKLLGFFVVRKGHPFSPEIDLEWRISFSLQERKLIFDLTDVQYKCYVVLKMINRDFLQLECITTYHWKTCLFYMIEKNDPTVWERKLLFHCVNMCIEQMLRWVRIGCCPNYFIPAENLFEGRINDNLKKDSENKLVEILNVGFAILVRVHSYNICDYARARTNFYWSQKLKAESCRAYTKKIFMRKASLYQSAMHGLNVLFDKFKTSEKTPNVIEIFWRMLNHINHTDTVSEHTRQETRHALSLLLPFIYTCLASNISAIGIQQSNPQVRDFLLLGSYSYFMKGDLPGRLKFISVLYAAGCYKDCEWYLDQEDEEFIMKNPSVCVSDYMMGVSDPNVTIVTAIQQLKMSTCVFFLPTELPVIPAALIFELFKNYGMSSHKTASDDYRWNWDHVAEVDCTIFYFMLKFLVNREVKKDKLSNDALYDIQKIEDYLFESDVIHRDVAYNLLAWCYCSVGWNCKALCVLRQSWYVHRLLSPLLFLIRKKKKQQHYLLNSAKLHALVVLYNIWFSRKPLLFQFCFQCLISSKDTLQKCNRCKTATYCSRQCQRKNWKIHKTVCEIVRR